MVGKYSIPTTRIEAFSDGVCAIVMTLLAFQFKVPSFTLDANMQQNFRELLHVAPNFVSFVFSFIFVAVFWVNHHLLFHSIKHTDRKLLWLNIHLLFWLTIIPFPTNMVGDYPFVSLPAICLAVVLLMVSVSSFLVRHYSFKKATLENENTSARVIKEGIAQNVIAILLNLAAIVTAFFSVTITYIIFLLVLIIFSIPHSSESKQNNKKNNL